MVNVSFIKNNFEQYLKNKFSINEISSMWFNWVVKDIFKMSHIEYFLKGDFSINKIDQNQINSLISHLLSGKPIQYFFGYTYFKDLKIKVDSSVLIPRPETEQLIDLVDEYVSQNIKYNILDIGTGSGCIAIALKKNIKSHLTAIDICNNAIKTAKKNALLNNVLIDFKLIDINNIKHHKILPKIDFIVSNPPYVLHSEVASDSIIHAEPDLAIFVPDSSPLIFYHSICQFAKTNLIPGGKIFFEINPKLISDLVKIINEYGYCNIKIHKDFYKKTRFIVVSS